MAAEPPLWVSSVYVVFCVPRCASAEQHAVIVPLQGQRVLTSSTTGHKNRQVSLLKCSCCNSAEAFRPCGHVKTRPT